MGSFKEGRDESHKEQKERVKTCIVYSWSFMVSMIGGLAFTWWEFEYHPTNTQLWMVPFSLILLVTPLFVWFSIFVSDLCSSKMDDVPKASQPVRPPAPDNSACDLERGSKKLPTNWCMNPPLPPFFIFYFLSPFYSVTSLLSLYFSFYWTIWAHL